LSVVRHICDRVAVMYVGKIVEMADTLELYAAPKHPYTAALMSAVPVADPRIKTGSVELKGEVPSPANPPSGCYFHPRCEFVKDECRARAPEFREISPNHFVACHRADELRLAGIG
jgi:peptide/nickel transport system ATP-binding protein